MSGYVGDLSPEQEAALQEFKTILEDIPNKPDDTDYYYLRWLRARKFDLKKTELMFRNHMDFRRKYGADTILQDYTPPPLFTECFAGGTYGEDLDGNPVWYDNVGNLDGRGILQSISSIDEVLKFKCWHYEKLAATFREYSEKKGRLMETITIVVDFKNLSFRKHYYWPGIELLKTVLTSVEENNPECVKKAFLVNTPSIFPFCYNIVKHVLDERTRNKILVFGINSNLKEELQKYISLDELPAMYGGNRMEPDPECSDYIPPGRDVPPKYFLANQMESSKEQMEKVMVKNRSTHKMTFVVDEVGSTLQWEFFSTDYDIAFGVFLNRKVADKTEKTIIRASSRCDSHRFPQTGHHTCELAGEYVVSFDNSYSWKRSKEVFFTIKVLPPTVKPEESHVAGISLVPDPEDEGKFKGRAHGDDEDDEERPKDCDGSEQGNGQEDEGKLECADQANEQAAAM